MFTDPYANLLPMSKLRNLGHFCAVAVGAAVWFALFLPWHGWNDPDAYYHATASRLLWEHGPIQSFPWLDLTLLGSSYADLHFGFHLVVAPFTAVFGDLQGLRISSLLLAALCVAVFEACLRWLRIRNPLVWTMMLVASYPFVLRALLGKATPLAVLIFLIGLAGAWKRGAWCVGFMTFLFALSHGGWLYLAGSVVLLAFGDALYVRIVDCRSWREVIVGSRWREVCAAFAGGILGLVVHPNFPNVFRFAWAQVVTIGLGTPYSHVLLGREWSPSPPSGVLVNFAPFIILTLLGLCGLVFARREPLDTDKARLLVSIGWILAVLTALTLKSRRNAEYLAPIIALWCGVLWSLVDARRLKTWCIEAFRTLPRWASRVLPVLIVGAFFIVIGKQIFELRTDLNPSNYTDATYQESMTEISKRAEPGDRVFHTSWDEFPMLFHADRRLKYISGLDPTFLYIASSTLSDKVRNVTWDISTSTKEETWSLIHDELQSKFIFASRENHGVFLKRISDDPRYILIASSTDSAAFVVSSTSP